MTSIPGYYVKREQQKVMNRHRSLSRRKYGKSNIQPLLSFYWWLTNWHEEAVISGEGQTLHAVGVVFEWGFTLHALQVPQQNLSLIHATIPGSRGYHLSNKDTGVNMFAMLFYSVTLTGTGTANSNFLQFHKQGYIMNTTVLYFNVYFFILYNNLPDNHFESLLLRFLQCDLKRQIPKWNIIPRSVLLHDTKAQYICKCSI